MASPLSVTSTLFDEGGDIPIACAHPSAGGQNTSPDLSWTGLPDGTASIAVTCWDPDAPTTVGFCHWILANLPASTTSLATGAGAAGAEPNGAVSCLSDWGEAAYGGMAPPPGDEPHHYHFTVYALGVERLDVDATTTYAKFRFLTREHVLAVGTLMGRFGR